MALVGLGAESSAPDPTNSVADGQANRSACQADNGNGSRVRRVEPIKAINLLEQQLLTLCIRTSSVEL